MNRRLFIILLCLIPIESSQMSGCADITGCSLCRTMVDGYFEYQCHENDNDLAFTFQYQPNDMVYLECSTESVKLSNFPGFNLTEISNIHRLFIAKCFIAPDFALGEFAKRIGMKSVESFTLSRISYNNTLKARNFHGFEELTRLTIASLGLPYLEEDLLEGTPNLEILNLRDNRVNVSREFFKRIPNLKTLELAENHISEILPGTFEYLGELRLLNIWRNDLKRLDESMFSNLTSLTGIDFTNNPLEEIAPGTFSALTSLKVTQFHEIKLSKLPSGLFANNKMLDTVKILKNALNVTEMADGLFSNLTKLNSVSMQRLGLLKIPENTFRGSINITEIDLGDNFLREIPQNLFQGLSNLIKLAIASNQIEALPNNLFADLGKLEYLDLKGNKIKVINEGDFTGLVSLKQLNMPRNQLEEIHSKAILMMQKLERIDLSHNYLTLETDVIGYMPQSSPFQNCFNLKVLILHHNNISRIFSDWAITLTHLSILDLSYNNITTIDSADIQFLSHGLHVNLRKNNIETVQFRAPYLIIKAAEIASPMNVKIDISENPIICDCHMYNFRRFVEGKLSNKTKNLYEFTMKPLLCAGPPDMLNVDVETINSDDLVCDSTNTRTVCPESCNCKYSPGKRALLVDCSYRNMNDVPTLHNTHKMYGADTNIFIHLNISGNHLKELPNVTDSEYNYVTEIYASHNHIKSITPDNILPKLKVLEVDYNNITLLQSDTIAKMTSNESSITRLKLSNNPWTCTCEARDLLLFVQTYYYLFSNQSSVICSTNNRPFIDLTINDICVPSELIIIISVLLAMIAIFVAVILVFYFRYQIEIKIWLYAHQCCLGLITEDDLDKDKPYDAFISYSHKDEHFVVNELVKKLESGPNPYKLCLHYRDWMAGDLIPSQIARSVEDSKRTIIVLSKNFLTSIWGAMEFRAAHRQALVEGRARVIVVIYGDVPSDNELDTELKAYLKMNTYVQWGDKWFWDKLRYAMPHGPKMRGFDKKSTNNNDANSMLKINIKNSPTVGQSMLNMPTVSIVPNNKISEKTDGNLINEDLEKGREIIMNGSAKKNDILHNILNGSLLKKSCDKEDKLDDSINEDDGGFKNRSLYGNIILNFNNAHSTTV